MNYFNQSVLLLKWLVAVVAAAEKGSVSIILLLVNGTSRPIVVSTIIIYIRPLNLEIYFVLGWHRTMICYHFIKGASPFMLNIIMILRKEGLIHSDSW